MKKLAHKEDCEIIRSDSEYNCKIDGRAVIYETDMGALFDVPEEWSDEQIWECLRIANGAHDKGFSRGQLAKTVEIRRVLDL